MTDEPKEKFNLSFGRDPLDENDMVLLDMTRSEDVVRINLAHPMGPMITYMLLDMLNNGSAEIYQVPPISERN